MNIHEYQAKRSLSEVRHPVPARASPRSTVDRGSGGRRRSSSRRPGARSSSSRRRSTRAVAARPAASRSSRARRTPPRSAARELLGMQLVTKQTGPEGKKVQRLLVEQGARHRARALPRARRRPRVAPHRGDGVDRRRSGHRGGRREAAGEDPQGPHRPGRRALPRTRRASSRSASASGQARPEASSPRCSRSS